MPESPPTSPETDPELPDLWPAIEADVTDTFGGDVDVTVTEYDDHLDVRIMPNGAVEEIEAEHDGLTVVPYNACQMTIRTEE